MRSMYLAAAASLCASLVACTVDDDLPKTSQSWQNEETMNRLSMNRLAGNRLAGNRLAGNRLAGNRLAGNALSGVALGDTSEILTTPSGRIVYAYTISCALDFGMTIVADNIRNDCKNATTVGDKAECDPVNGQLADDDHCGPTAGFAPGHCEFQGGVGVAPEWMDEPLDKHGQGWVSACLFSRVNLHDVAESISLRGRNPALSVTVDEAEQYPVEEGAFFGNLFSNGDDNGDDDNHGHHGWFSWWWGHHHDSTAIDWNACEGEGQAAGEDGGLALRDCTEPDPANPGKTLCGFNYTGHCRDFLSTGEAYACDNFTGSPDGYYGDCHAKPSKKSAWFKGKKYREVITTYVAQ